MSDAFLALVLGVAPQCETVSAWDELSNKWCNRREVFCTSRQLALVLRVLEVSTWCSGKPNPPRTKGGRALCTVSGGSFALPVARTIHQEATMADDSDRSSTLRQWRADAGEHRIHIQQRIVQRLPLPCSKSQPRTALPPYIMISPCRSYS